MQSPHIKNTILLGKKLLNYMYKKEYHFVTVITKLNRNIKKIIFFFFFLLFNNIIRSSASDTSLPRIPSIGLALVFTRRAHIAHTMTDVMNNRTIFQRALSREEPERISRS